LSPSGAGAWTLQKADRVLRLLRGLAVAADTDVAEEALMREARRHRLSV
jgi:hypothetical protein